MPQINPIIEESWRKALWNEFQSDYFSELRNFLKTEMQTQTIYPPGHQIFNAFNLTPLDKVRVVILGQDPYHGPGQAHGLCFSVPKGVKPPPSLVNIFKEMASDLKFDIPAHGNLESWSKQGVLLLNATLSVRASQAGSHQKRGWEQFTDRAIQFISEEKENVVFILWGRYAQAKEALIDQNKHLILKSAHPSPLSAYNGFFGSKPFSKTNSYLKENGFKEIDWRL